MRLLLLRAFSKKSCFLPIQCRTVLCHFCVLLLNTAIFGASQPCEQFVTIHFSLAASFFLQEHVTFVSSSLAALYSLYLKQLSAERYVCVCVCVVPFLSYLTVAENKTFLCTFCLGALWDTCECAKPSVAGGWFN